MKVGVLTTFYNFSSSFSLTTVVKQQLLALVKYGYSPVLFVLENFSEQEMSKVPEGVDVRRVIPKLILEPYAQGNLDNLDSDVEKARLALEENMSDIDVCLSHDIIFINTYLPYNIALRKAQEGKLSNVKFLHWMHSGPSIRPRMDGSPHDNLWTLPKNSNLVYMNNTDVIRAAEHYDISTSKVRTIFNPMDIRVLHRFTKESIELIEEYDLMSPEILITYPLSTTRMGIIDGVDGKQLDKVIRVVAHIKARNRSVRLVVCNAHANGQREKDSIEKMYKFAYSLGLERRDIVFTSLFQKPKFEHGVPHEVVRDMLMLSNVFIFPSVSENCPLVLLEAAASGTLPVLNMSFPAMHDFLQDDAMYFRFASNMDNAQYPNGLDKYMRDVAVLLLDRYDREFALKAKTRARRFFNVDYLFKRQLEPAILDLYNNE